MSKTKSFDPLLPLDQQGLVDHLGQKILTGSIVFWRSTNNGHNDFPYYYARVIESKSKFRYGHEEVILIVERASTLEELLTVKETTAVVYPGKSYSYERKLREKATIQLDSVTVITDFIPLLNKMKKEERTAKKEKQNDAAKEKTSALDGLLG